MKIDRRQFLRLSTCSVAGLSLFRDLSWAMPQAVAGKSDNSKKVAVLGAGLAGLTSAWELKRTGYDVTILEAQLHPGGRVHTIREGLSDGFYAEAGAGRIPAAHKVTREWVKYFGLELEPFYPIQLAQVAILQGKRIKIPETGHPIFQRYCSSRRKSAVSGC